MNRLANESKVSFTEKCVGVTLVSMLFGGAGFGAYYGQRQMSKATEIEETIEMPAAIREMTEDGFVGESKPYSSVYGRDRIFVQLHLGQCTLHEVQAEVTRSEDGEIIEVGDYSIEVKAYPSIESRYDTASKSRETYVEGSDVVFEFENQQEFTDVFGTEPCATFARSSHIG